MEKKELKKRTFSGLAWKLGERVSAQVVSLIVSIMLARLLTPDDYSIVGIVTIFFAFANVLISSGLNTALIQKKDADIIDYSTVLFFSIVIAILMYFLIFFSAPSISKIYSKEELVPVFRIMGLALVVNAVKSVVCAYISSTLQFKKFFFATIIGTVISGIVGVGFALKGFGCWALVAQYMTNTIIDTIILFISTRIHFVLKISIIRFRQLFRFGWKVFVTQMISVVYDKINPMIIGIKYTTTDLAYYTKGASFPDIINSSLTDTFAAVLFPVMSKMQDDKGSLLIYLRRYISTASFVIFPTMLGFFAVSDNFIKVVLTEKWLPASVYMKILCISYMFNIIHVGNLQVIKALGKSEITLIMETIKKGAYLIVIVLFVFFTNKPEMLAITCVINTVIAAIVNTYPNKKLIGYKYTFQAQDIFLNLVNSTIMALAVMSLNAIRIDAILLLIIQIISGIVVYVVLSIVTKNQNFEYLKDMINKKGAL